MSSNSRGAARVRAGADGEALAGAWLERRGFAIEARNVRGAGGEIDLVARHGRTLVFVEVKTRGQDPLATGTESVTPDKQRRIVRAALMYLKRFGARPPACRFDVVEIRTGGNAPVIRHWPDAFRAEWA